jgi:hypothetical protein
MSRVPTHADLAAAVRAAEIAFPDAPLGKRDPSIGLRRSGFRVGYLEALATRESSAVPEGWKLVPIELTSAMEDDAMTVARFQYGHGVTRASIAALHKALLAAAPNPSAQQAEAVASKITEEKDRNGTH